MNLQKLNANLIKKYHQDLVFNYSEYPTKDHWKFEFKNDEYKDAILEWFPKTQKKKFSFMFIYLFVNSFAGFALVANLLPKITKE